MFSKVDLSTRLKLYDLYKIDFELFEYSADKYLQEAWLGSDELELFWLLNLFDLIMIKKGVLAWNA